MSHAPARLVFVAWVRPRPSQCPPPPLYVHSRVQHTHAHAHTRIRTARPCFDLSGVRGCRRSSDGRRDGGQARKQKQQRGRAGGGKAVVGGWVGGLGRGGRGREVKEGKEGKEGKEERWRRGGEGSGTQAEAWLGSASFRSGGEERVRARRPRVATASSTTTTTIQAHIVPLSGPSTPSHPHDFNCRTHPGLHGHHSRSPSPLRPPSPPLLGSLHWRANRVRRAALRAAAAAAAAATRAAASLTVRPRVARGPAAAAGDPLLGAC